MSCPVVSFYRPVRHQQHQHHRSHCRHRHIFTTASRTNATFLDYAAPPFPDTLAAFSFATTTTANLVKISSSNSEKSETKTTTASPAIATATATLPLSWPPVLTIVLSYNVCGCSQVAAPSASCHHCLQGQTRPTITTPLKTCNSTVPDPKVTQLTGPVRIIFQTSVDFHISISLTSNNFHNSKKSVTIQAKFSAATAA